MGRLYKAPGRKTWMFKVKINGQEKTWSTGETNKNKAMAVKARMEAEAQSRRELCAGHSKDRRNVKLTIAAELEVKRLRQDISDRRADRVDYMLNNFVEWVGNDELKLGQITTELLEEYQRARLETAAKDTVDAELTAIKCLLEQNKIHVAKPKPKPGKKSKVRHFTDAELPLFFAHVDPTYLTLFMTMLATGARPAEMVPSERSTHKPLLKTEVDLKSGIIMTRSSKVKRGEEGEMRPVQVEPYLIERLKEQISTTSEDYPYVFVPMTRISRVFNKAVMRAGIPARDHLGAKLTAHSFRHTYDTHHSKNGCNQFKLMVALGHTISTTARYVHAKAPRISLDLGAMAPKKKAADYMVEIKPVNAPEQGGRVQGAGADEDDFVIIAI